MLATDFISHARPRTHHNLLPVGDRVRRELERFRDQDLRRSPVFGRQIVGVE